MKSWIMEQISKMRVGEELVFKIRSPRDGKYYTNKIRMLGNYCYEADGKGPEYVCRHGVKNGYHETGL